MKIWVTKL